MTGAAGERAFTNVHTEDGKPLEVVGVLRTGKVTIIRTEGRTDSRAEAFRIANAAAEREGMAFATVRRTDTEAEYGELIEVSRHAVHADGFRAVEAAEHDEALSGGFACADDCPECAAVLL